MKKFISVLLTIAMMLSMVATVFAGDISIITPDAGAITGTKIETLTKNILGLVQWIAMAFAVGMLLYIAIKYMMSSANEKADLKKGLINYVIGAGLMFGVTAILEAIKAWMI